MPAHKIPTQKLWEIDTTAQNGRSDEWTSEPRTWNSKSFHLVFETLIWRYVPNCGRTKPPIPAANPLNWQFSVGFQFSSKNTDRSIDRHVILQSVSQSVTPRYDIAVGNVTCATSKSPSPSPQLPLTSHNKEGRQRWRDETNSVDGGGRPSGARFPPSTKCFLQWCAYV